MIQMNAVQTGPLRSVSLFEKHAAGSESNVAIGLSRFGNKSGFISRVGDDEFGKFIISTLKGEDVDVSQVKIDREMSTGVYFVQRWYPVPPKSITIYYRGGSAASRLSPDDIEPTYIGSAKILHVSGITPALSKSCSEAVLKALVIAKKHGVKVSFDTNIRKRLWTIEKARRTLTPMLSYVDYLFTDPNDAKILFEEEEPKRICQKALQAGPSLIVVKMPDAQYVAMTKDEYVEKKGYQAPVVDVIGAGDAFAAGVLASLLKGLPLEKAISVGNAASALKVTVRGDFEALPSWEDVETFLSGAQFLR
jgi:sugar/nucleoside kinase (ribokinase family)